MSNIYKIRLFGFKCQLILLFDCGYVYSIQCLRNKGYGLETMSKVKKVRPLRIVRKPRRSTFKKKKIFLSRYYEKTNS